MIEGFIAGIGGWFHAVFLDGFEVWIAIGFLAQALFSARFFVQWIASERAGRSVVPVAFWFFSVAGGAMLFAYAIWREDPVFIVGQGAGLLIYLRNIWLIVRERRSALGDAA